MSTTQDKINKIEHRIKSYSDFPKPGILFWDVFSIFAEPDLLGLLRDVLIDFAKQTPVDCVVGLDARGFLFGPLIALELKVPFVPIRKKGKLPGPCESVSYTLEYGKDTVEIQRDIIKPGQQVLIVDDLLATGGTLKAACDLVGNVGGVVSTCLVIIELPELNGRSKISAPIQSIIKK